MRIVSYIVIILLLNTCSEGFDGEPESKETESRITGNTSVFAAKDRAAAQIKCNLLFEQAEAYSRQGRVKESIMADSTALRIAEKALLVPEMISIIKRLERKYAIQLQRTQSYQLINKGLKLAREIGDKKAEIDFIAARGMWYFYGGEFDKALPISEECLAKSRAINYSFGISSALADIGSIYMNLKNEKKGVEYFMACKPFADSLKGTTYESQIYQLLASAYLESNQHDSAQVYINKAIRTAELQQDKKVYAACQASLANILIYEGRYNEAIEVARRSIALCREINFKAQIINNYVILRNIALKQGDHKLALTYFEAYAGLKDTLRNDQTLLKEQEKEYVYTLEKKERENQLLLQKNQIQEFQISKTRYVIFGFIFLLLLLLMIGTLLFRQARLKTENWKMSAEQKLLRAQMNPHFIFNSLNSIRYFILSKQNAQAENYLATFSRLIRNSLESSIDDTVSVDREVEMLKDYLGIEALRFNGVFEYEIHIDDALKVNTVRIPQLMIQPFVENAIWHGLLPKKNNRKLLIQLLPGADSGKIRCVIDDNGVGRTAAAQNKSLQKEKHLAIEFVQQRLLLYKKAYHSDCRLTLTDKFDENGDADGLCVVLELPNLYQYKLPVRNEV
ncbi:MAG: histidine kinase [Bacteroidetes bacterium]|nr:histidine kinase [Bacteroidota bacterium]